MVRSPPPPWGRAMTAAPVYEASPVKRARATKAEMEERAEFLIDYASEHGPVTVRGLYYQAEVASLPGISKRQGLRQGPAPGSETPPRRAA